MNQQEQTSAVLNAKALAAADCAASVRMTLMLTGGVPEGVQNPQAYRNAVRRISDGLTQDAIDADARATAYAESLRPA